MAQLAERFLNTGLISMYMLQKYEFFGLFCERLGSNIGQDPAILESMPVSNNFKGNFFRLRAVFFFKMSKNEMNMIRIIKRLERAEKFYLMDENYWGLGLTYNLIGRFYSIKENQNPT